MSRIIESGGFLPLGGSARRYLDLYSGKEYSRREAERIIRNMSSADRELRGEAALQRRSGSIVRDFIETRQKTIYDPLTPKEIRELRDIFDAFKSKDKNKIDLALKKIGRRRDDDIPIS